MIVVYLWNNSIFIYQYNFKIKIVLLKKNFHFILIIFQIRIYVLK